MKNYGTMEKISEKYISLIPQSFFMKGLKTNMKSNIRFIAVLVFKILMGIVAQVFKIFPIKNNRIVFFSHRGRQYSDSPKYISKYLLHQFAGKYEIIWGVEDKGKFKDLESKGIKLIKSFSLADFYYSNTAKVFVSNMFGPFPHIVRRKNRIIIETSHGVAYKDLITERENMKLIAFCEKKHKAMKMNMCDYALSGNSILTDRTYRNNLDFKGKVLEFGLPRNDIFFQSHDDIKEKVRNHFRIDSETRILLVMPTWRKDNSRKNIEFDYGRILSSLEQKDGSKWICLLRLHHLSEIDITDILGKYESIIRNATDYPDPQELLLTGDMLITDYSSVVWDFALQKKPICIYAPDVLSYNEERGFNVPPNEWGLFKAEKQNELYKMIEEYSLSDFAQASEAHLKRFGNCETGKATETVCRMINNYCNTGVFN